jgi:hypothetical protein
MIVKKTVLILGAGASMPLDYPSGRGLLQEVVKKFAWDSAPDHNHPLVKVGFDPKEIHQFRRALVHSGRQSVDAFLEHQPDFVEIGKAAIALHLIRFEKPNALFDPSVKSENGVHWYPYLLDQIATDFERFGDNKLSIITFNYDRSLEHFLYTALCNSFPKKSDEICELLGTIPIIHVHGRLDPLPHEANDGRPYHYQLRSDYSGHVTRAAAGIKIIHEIKDIDNDLNFARAHERIAQADFICFLGFGYHPSNIERLRLPKEKRVRIIGSGCGLGEGHRRHAARAISPMHIQTKQIPEVIGDPEMDCLAYLQHTGVLLDAQRA